MIKNYQKGVKGFTKVEPNRLRIKNFYSAKRIRKQKTLREHLNCLE